MRIRLADDGLAFLEAGGDGGGEIRFAGDLHLARLDSAVVDDQDVLLAVFFIDGGERHGDGVLVLLRNDLHLGGGTKAQAIAVAIDADVHGELRLGGTRWFAGAATCTGFYLRLFGRRGDEGDLAFVLFAGARRRGERDFIADLDAGDVTLLDRGLHQQRGIIRHGEDGAFGGHAGFTTDGGDNASQRGAQVGLGERVLQRPILLGVAGACRRRRLHRMVHRLGLGGDLVFDGQVAGLQCTLGIGDGLVGSGGGALLFAELAVDATEEAAIGFLGFLQLALGVLHSFIGVQVA